MTLMHLGSKLVATISSTPDFPTIHVAGGKAYLINHFEIPLPSSLYISEVTTDASGALKITSTKPVPDAKVGGLWHVRAGGVTPWGTHLASEKLPLDCRSYDEFFVPCKAGPDAAKTFCGLARAEDDVQSLKEFARYYGYYAGGTQDGLGEVDILTNQKAHGDFVRRFRCYNYGASPEVRVLPGGTTQLTKIRTLGRISHENAVVMPDNRRRGLLLKFVADRPNDLSSGTLSAIKLSKQRRDATGRAMWEVSWVELGRGNQADLDKLALSGLRFADIFETATPKGSPPKCPASFSATNHPSLIYQVQDKVTYASYHMECLKVKPGMEVAAAFFESRRLAAVRGATTEFERQDGLTWSPRFRQLYFADARIAKGMTSDAQFNHASLNAIDLPESVCGGVFAVDLDASYSGTLAKMIVGGDRLKAEVAAEKCNPNNVADPEKTEYLAGNLIIQESSPARDEAIMWAFNLEDGALTKILTAPKGAELTGVTASRIGNNAYLALTVQQPQDPDAPPPATAAEAEARQGSMGYIGPLPADILTEQVTLRFDPLKPGTKAPAGSPVAATTRVCIAPAKKGQAKPAGYSQ